MQQHSEGSPKHQTVQSLQKHFIPGSKDWSIKIQAQTLAELGQSTYDYLMQQGKAIAVDRKAKANQLRDQMAHLQPPTES